MGSGYQQTWFGLRRLLVCRRAIFLQSGWKVRGDCTSLFSLRVEMKDVSHLWKSQDEGPSCEADHAMRPPSWSPEPWSSPRANRGNSPLPRSWLNFRVQFDRRCLVQSEALQDDEMANPNASKNTRWLIYLLVFLVLTLAVVIAGRGAGRWLVREDTLSSADAIVVLSGSMPCRAEEAGKLFKMGKAPEVWVSRPENPAAALQKFGIQFVGEEEYNREILIHQGVPESSVHIFPDPIVNTEQEVNEIVREMRRAGKKKSHHCDIAAAHAAGQNTVEEACGKGVSVHRPRCFRGPVRRRSLVV